MSYKVGGGPVGRNPQVSGLVTLRHHSKDEGPGESMGNIYVALGEPGSFIKVLQNPALDTQN